MNSIGKNRIKGEEEETVGASNNLTELKIHLVFLIFLNALDKKESVSTFMNLFFCYSDP